MWERATSESLVLLDELGGATDPEEGAAIATAVLDEMGKRGALTIATTHLTSLKVFVQERPEINLARRLPGAQVGEYLPGRFFNGQRGLTHSAPVDRQSNTRGPQGD